MRIFAIMEKFYQYIWLNSLWPLFSARRLVDGREIRLINPGTLNSDAGPDFFNSRIAIDDTQWTGNVEIHVKASDWYRHGHDKDTAYDSVILHVVAVDDARIRRPDGTEIPQLVISAPPEIMEAYGSLAEPGSSKPCTAIISDLSPLYRAEWMSRMGTERIQDKADRILAILDSLGGDWEQTCFAALARALGFGLNGDPLEILAKNLPLKILAHHADNILHIEALLFGQAGMLDSSKRILDEYYQILCREYLFLARKYSLRQPGIASAWKYARTRPANFPHRRIALLAGIISAGSGIMSRILEAGSDMDALQKIFSARLSDYWSSHFSFDTESEWSPVALTGSSLESIYINTVVPLNYAYGQKSGDWQRMDVATEILESIHAERNSITRIWDINGIKPANSFESQALIHLHKNYCLENKCTQCRWGQRVFRHTVETIRR